MSSTLASRMALRQSRQLLRGQQFRQASTAAETAAKAKETASANISKAQEGLTRVTSSAGPAITNAANSARSALSRVGGRTGRLISFVECTLRAHDQNGKYANRNDSINTTHHLLQPCRPRACETHLPGSEDVSSVSPSASHTIGEQEQC